jgi:hypothetical protein
LGLGTSDHTLEATSGGLQKDAIPRGRFLDPLHHA